MAALTATQALDFAALAAGEPPSLVADEAEALAREYLARNLAAVGVPSAASVSANAQVAWWCPARSTRSGAIVSEAPTVSIRASVPTAASDADADRARADGDASRSRDRRRRGHDSRSTRPLALPAIALLALAIALAVVALILLPRPAGRAGQLADADQRPNSRPPPQLPATRRRAAVRAFFEAFAEARETSDPSVIEPFVNGTDSSAYLTAAAFLDGQAEQGKARSSRCNELTDFDVDEQDDAAVVSSPSLASGYDIDLETGEPLESPDVLPTQPRRGPSSSASMAAGSSTASRTCRVRLVRLLSASLLAGVGLARCSPEPPRPSTIRSRSRSRRGARRTVARTSACRRLASGPCRRLRWSRSSRLTTRSGT